VLARAAAGDGVADRGVDAALGARPHGDADLDEAPLALRERPLLVHAPPELLERVVDAGVRLAEAEEVLRELVGHGPSIAARGRGGSPGDLGDQRAAACGAAPPKSAPSTFSSQPRFRLVRS